MKYRPIITKFIKIVLSSIFIYSLSLAAAEKPNILILYGDDLGYGDLGCYNPDSKIPTPHLNQLASEGMLFTDGHSSSGICTPSRYALLTGKYHWRSFYSIVKAFGRSSFKAQELTLPEMLQENGYTTSAIGKWHLGWNWNSIKKPDAKTRPLPFRGAKKDGFGHESFYWDKAIEGGPCDHGFDYYFGDTVINFPPYCWIENEHVTEAPNVDMDESLWPELKEGKWECRPGPMIEGWNPYDNIPTTTAKAIEKINEYAKDEKPFFMYFALPSPHAPIVPNDEFDGRSKAGPYGDFLVESDEACGKILQALKDAGLEENTIVLFSADNGPEHYAYPRFEKYDHWSAYPLRALKRSIYEGGHRVPFIVKWPKHIEAGSKSEALVSQIDIMATLADIIGYNLPQNQAHDSFSFTPVLSGQKTTVRDTLIHNTKASLAKENPEKVVELQALINQIREQGYSAPHIININEPKG